MSPIFDTAPRQSYRSARKCQIGRRHAVSLALQDLWIQWRSWWRFKGPGKDKAEDERRAGASSQEAQRRAITAFGSQEEVAARFEAGLIGGLDRRLAVTARRLDVWMARHPWGGAVLRTALFVPAAALLAGLGLAFGARRRPGGRRVACTVGGVVPASRRPRPEAATAA